MIVNFRCRDSESVFRREPVGRWPLKLQLAARQRLAMLDAAADLMDLRVPPGNRLEKLAGNRAGQYSIRINRQWRICFRWHNGHALDVEIADYH